MTAQRCDICQAPIEGCPPWGSYCQRRGCGGYIRCCSGCIEEPGHKSKARAAHGQAHGEVA